MQENVTRLQKNALVVGRIVGQEVFIVDTAANRQCDKDVAIDVGDFSEAIKHYFRFHTPASVTAYAAVGSDETKSFRVFIELNVKANSAGYRENAGRKRVSVVKNAYEIQYLVGVEALIPLCNATLRGLPDQNNGRRPSATRKQTT